MMCAVADSKLTRSVGFTLFNAHLAESGVCACFQRLHMFMNIFSVSVSVFSHSHSSNTINHFNVERRES
jgi:hypothetical protein